MRPTRAALVAIALACGLIGLAAARPAGAVKPIIVRLEACAWDRPGHDPFVGDVVAAVDHYPDIPPDARARLKARMAGHDYDDLVSIRRDSITGLASYGATISDMHFGTRRVCRSVSRAAWGEEMQERGMVYCDSGHCILVPTVCRNVSRIVRAAAPDDRAPAPAEVKVEALATAGTEDGRAVPGAEVASSGLVMDGLPSFAALADARGTGGPGAPAGGSFGAPGATGVAGAGGAAGSGGLPSSPGPTIAAIPAAPVRSDSWVPPIVLTPVPEPRTWALMAGALAAQVAWRRRRLKR